MPFPEIPFAKVTDLEARWRQLNPDEKVQALVLLEDASQMIIDECPRAKDASLKTLKRVACSIVKRGMQSPPVLGADTIQQGGLGYTASVKFTNPAGDLYLSASEKRSLGCGRQRAFTIDLMGGGGDVPDP